MLNNSVQVKGLQKSFRQFNALKGIDFEGEKRNIFALPGSNDANKTAERQW